MTEPQTPRTPPVPAEPKAKPASSSPNAPRQRDTESADKTFIREWLVALLCQMREVTADIGDWSAIVIEVLDTEDLSDVDRETVSLALCIATHAGAHAHRALTAAVDHLDLSRSVAGGAA